MKAIKLKIDLATAKAGDVVEMENGIARHFIGKGWGVEDIAPEPVKVKAPESPAKPKVRNVIGRNIQKK